MTVGFTCGAFDLCHAGHMRMLKDAKEQCHWLIVGLQDDPSQERDLKYRLNTGGRPKNHPIMSMQERLEILQGIKYVDEIFVYSTEKDLYERLQHLEFDIRILGSDWKGKKYTGYDLPHKPYFHERSHNYSTTELRKRIASAEKCAQDEFLDIVRCEANRARSMHGHIRSTHEGLGLIEEEWWEVKQEIFKKVPDKAEMLKELSQVAALCTRFAEDCGLLRHEHEGQEEIIKGTQTPD